MSGQPPSKRRDRLIQSERHDAYRARGKFSDPTVCPTCGAVFRAGRWSWGEAPLDAPRASCPACLRVHDQDPAGRLRLEGTFVRSHRQEILARARNVEERERAEHPLKRIMAIRDDGDALEITTTDAHLAHGIGEALRSAYEGELSGEYGTDEPFARLQWHRDA